MGFEILVIPKRFKKQVVLKDDYYYKLLKHPKWFRKRDSVLERDHHKCTVCGSKKNLQVHHTYYVRDNMPEVNYG